MESSDRALTFIVRVTPADAGEIAGTVERVRTGEKHRFSGLDALGTLIARIVAHEASPAASGRSMEPPQASESGAPPRPATPRSADSRRRRQR
jgi:hypothetical protein